MRLVYMACEVTGAVRAIETGVAYGWSSLAVLSSISKRPNSLLVSVDMEYPKRANAEWVGCVVPEEYRAHWRLIRRPDRNGITKALSTVGNIIDICHYDSDKSYYGRKWAYPILWSALRPGGIFISDDIQDNFAFRDFVVQLGLPFHVVKSGAKYVGVCIKPQEGPN